MIGHGVSDDAKSRAIQSAQSGLVLFGFAILLTLYMAAVIFLNGS